MPDKIQDDEVLMNLVELALDCPADEREAYVRAVCAGDLRLFNQVWEYVQWEQCMDGFLLEPLCSPASQEHPFEPGDLLDGRFRIVREVAQGGMGIVYEATDEKLERRIGLKCGKAGFRKRLPPEVRNATALSHPNICRIFEIHTAVTRVGEMDFLTMEFLDGETLGERLRRSPLPEAEARDIALQLCAGLAEAHRNHVVHGDLKSSNVILTSGPEGTMRAVITDFGLAFRPGVQTQVHGGTPNYMAPELWKGEEASPASDVYALGVILYEVVSGRQPWAPDLPWQERVAQSPPRPGSRWGRVISKCLHPDPRQRFHDAQEVEKTLAPGRSRLWWATAAAAVVLAAVTGVVTYRSSIPRESVKLAMLPLQSDQNVAALSKEMFRATADRLAHLRGGDHVSLRVVPGKKIESENVGTPEQAQARFGATHVLRGTIVKQQDKTTVHVWLTDMRSHVDMKDWEAVYTPGELRFAPAALASVVTATLRLPASATPAAVNAAAQQDYLKGLSALRFDSSTDAALTFLQRAVGEDPDSPLTHARLAEAEWFKYFLSREPQWLTRATESAREAELRDPDSAAVLRINGILDANAGLYEQAGAEYRRAIELEPANGDGYRRLGLVLARNGHTGEAQAEYEKALKADPDYYRTWQAMGALYSERGNYDEAVRYLARTVELAPKEPTAHYALGLALLNLGRYPDAEKELHSSVALKETPEALQTLGAALMYQGKERDAVTYIERALSHGPEHYQSWFNLGVAYRRLNQKAESTRALRRGLALAEAEMARDPRNGKVRSQLALLCAELGDRSRAESETEQALQLSPDDADTRWAAAVAYEALRERDKTLGVLGSSPPGVLADMNHWPDVADLHKDPRFLQLLASHNSNK